MSTLPELFRSTKSTYLRPFKQGGIFALKHKQTKEYETINHKKFSQSRVGTSCTTRTGNSARNSVSFGQRPYSRQSAKQQLLNYGTSRVCYAIYESRPNVQEADSLRHQLNECIQCTKIQKQSLMEITSLQTSLTAEIKQLQYSVECELSNINDTFGGYLQTFRRKISDCRRQTGMQIKVNNQNLIQLGDNLITIATFARQIQQNISQMQGQCLR